jgi:hypothetical protein
MKDVFNIDVLCCVGMFYDSRILANLQKTYLEPFYNILWAFFQSTNLLVQSFFLNLKKKLLTTNGNMSSRIFGEFFCNLAKEGKKKEDRLQRFCVW